MRKVVLVVAMFVSITMMSQKMEIVKGNFDFLKDQKEINVMFDYSKMTLLKEKKTEAQYVNDRTAELNQKNNGVGDVWKKKWDSSRELIWNPNFLELVNIVLTKENRAINFQEGLSSAKYTLIVETIWIYPGWDAGVMKQPAKVSTLLKFVETNNKSNVLLEILSESAPGSQWGSNFSNESRIGEGFAKTGKSLAKMMLKKAY